MKLLLDFCLVLRDSVFVLSMRCSLIFFFSRLGKVEYSSSLDNELFG